MVGKVSGQSWRGPLGKGGKFQGVTTASESQPLGRFKNFLYLPMLCVPVDSLVLSLHCLLYTPPNSSAMFLPLSPTLLLGKFTPTLKTKFKTFPEIVCGVFRCHFLLPSLVRLHPVCVSRLLVHLMRGLGFDAWNRERFPENQMMQTPKASAFASVLWSAAPGLEFVI